MTAVRMPYSEGSADESAVRYATRLATAMGQLLFELLFIFGAYCLASN